MSVKMSKHFKYLSTTYGKIKLNHVGDYVEPSKITPCLIKQWSNISRCCSVWLCFRHIKLVMFIFGRILKVSNST